jgi:hypothetical protein
MATHTRTFIYPIIYLYIYKIILKDNPFMFISKDNLYRSYKKVIYMSPAIVYFQITKDFICLNLLKECKNGFQICKNKEAIKKMNDLSDFAFSTV